jgi:cytochrome b involved in lipid metabolism
MKRNFFYFIVLSFIVFTTAGCGAKKIPASSSLLTPASSTLPIAGLTLQVVAEHNTAEDCWMVINNNIYNVTDHIQNHPGGKAIVSGCGKDATQLFNGIPHNHSDYARQLLANYYIGDLKK